VVTPVRYISTGAVADATIAAASVLDGLSLRLTERQRTSLEVSTMDPNQIHGKTEDGQRLEEVMEIAEKLSQEIPLMQWPNRLTPSTPPSTRSSSRSPRS
jgi:hypothetical protein